MKSIVKLKLRTLKLLKKKDFKHYSETELK